MFLSYLFFSLNWSTSQRVLVVIDSLNETVLQVMLRYSSIRLPAPFSLFQTVPKLLPKPGTHPVLEFQSVVWLILLHTRKCEI